MVAREKRSKTTKQVTLESLKQFIETMRNSEKSRAFGMVSVKGYYRFLTGRKPYTKTLKQTKRCREWMLDVWRPFSKTLTEKDWQKLGVYPSIGRDGFIAFFKYREG